MDQKIQSLIRKINNQRPVRLAQIRKTDSEEGKEAFEISFSSEEPYLRFFGYEILGHDEKEVDLSWLDSGRAPLLFEHDREKQIGVITRAWIENGRGKAAVRFGNSSLAQEVKADVADGIRTNISVGYEVHDMVKVPEKSNGETDTYRVTQWRPLENSSVSLPADETVGTDRSKPEPPTKDDTMSDEKTTPDAHKPEAHHIKTDSAADDQRRQQEQINLQKKAAENGAAAERERIAQIQDLAKLHKIDGEDYIKSGRSVQDFRNHIMDKYAAGQMPTFDPDKLTQSEKRDLSQYSFLKAVRETRDGKLSGLEKEMHEQGLQDVRTANVKETGNLQIPIMALHAHRNMHLQRDVTDATEGTDLTPTIVSPDFISVLRNRMVVRQAGARFLTGLTGDVQFPRMSAAGSIAWEGETDAGAETTQTFDNVSLTPNRVGAFTDLSNQLIIQSSPDIEALLREDLVTIVQIAIDLAAINGSGSGNQPTGILNTAGIGSVVCGDPDGAEPTWGDVVELETDVAAGNADMGRLAYLTNPQVRGKLKSTEKATNTAQFVWGEGNELNGYPAFVTSQVPSNGTKGAGTSLSAAIFGNFGDCLVGQWGGLAVLVDQYTQATAGMTRLVINTYADVAIRHAASFSAFTDAVT